MAVEKHFAFSLTTYSFSGVFSHTLSSYPAALG